MEREIISQTNSNGGDVMMTIDCTFAKQVNQQIIAGEGVDFGEISHTEAQAYNFELYDMPSDRPQICGCLSAQRCHDWFIVVRKKRRIQHHA